MTNTVPIIIFGALGRMGKEIGRVALEDPAVKVIACLERPGHPLLGMDFGSVLGVGERGIPISDSVRNSESAVLIHFATAETVVDALNSVSPESGGIVVGTTGLEAQVLAAVESATSRLPVVYSSNMSRGVNLLFRLTELVSAALKDDFDIEIVEAHHRMKKDSPSGTARTLGEIVSRAIGGDYDSVVKNGRSGMVGERPRREIGMHAVRGGDIVGDHTVLFAGRGERIELRHMAHSRSTFAQGAVAAAKWVAGRKPGLYTMRDVLGV